MAEGLYQDEQKQLRQATKTLEPLVVQAQQALATALQRVDKDRQPLLYQTIDALTHQLKDGQNYYEQISSSLYAALDSISRLDLNKLKGQYMAQSSLLRYNKDVAGKLLDELHRDSGFTDVYEKVRAFYEGMGKAVDALQPVKQKGFGENIDAKAWYQDIPILNRLFRHERFMVFVGLAIGIAAAIYTVSAWERKRKKLEHQGMTLPRSGFKSFDEL